MKFSFFFLFVLLIQVSAENSAQTISLSVKNESLKNVLKEIKKQSGYQLFYNENILRDGKSVTVSIKNTDLKSALDLCFKDQTVNYSIVNKTIVITKRLPVNLNYPIQQKPQVFHIQGQVVVGRKFEPLPGVSIRIKGLNKGAVSNANGRFEIDVEENAVLIFSLIGFITEEVIVNDQTFINLSLRPDIKALNEVVVVGYGTTARKDLTGSVASVKADEIESSPSLTIDDALDGKVAGVSITKADGSPGGAVRMRIRGGTSLLGGNDPLYIIDGVQVTPQDKYIQNSAEIVNPVEDNGNAVSGAYSRGLNNLGGLNINDIESIDILKDASATAIYGSKAANGVVIITTKKGKLNQKPIFEVNYSTGFSTPINEKRLNAEQYKMILKEGAQNLNDARAAQGFAADAVASQILNDPGYFGTANTDWIGLVTRTGIKNSADISVRGGGTGSRYYTSLSYTGQTGVLSGTDFSRISGKVGLDNEINPKFRVITNVDYGFSTNNLTNGIYSNAQYAPPTFSPYSVDGSINLFNGSSLGAYTNIQNPLTLLKGINNAKTATLLGALSLEYSILNSLKYKSTASVNYSSYHQLNYVPSIAKVSSDSGSSDSDGGIGSQGQTEQVDLFFENTLTWDKQFNANNRINLLMGTSWQKSKTNSFSASGQRFPDDDFLNGLSSAAIALLPTASNLQNSLLSFYLRSNYAFKERYLFTFTGRSDASSKFPKKNRVAYFPSFGVAWRLSEENFLKGAKWLDELKLRASAGYTGTQNIGNNMFYTLYSPAAYGGKNALIPTQLGNDEIKWETTLQRDLGLDFSLFNARLRGTIGYYQKNTSGILLATNTPSSSGFSSVLKNIADIRNNGLEFDLRGDFVNKKDFQWSGSFNLSFNRSKVLKINRDMDNASSSATTGDPFMNSVTLGNSIVREGQPLGLLFGYKFKGIIKTQEELEAYKSKSILAQYGAIPYLGIGDAMYEIEDTGTYKGYFKPDVIGHGEPKFTGGYTNTLTYKGFSLIMLFTFSYGGDLFYLADMDNIGLSEQSNKGTRILDRYTAINTNSNRPRLILGRPGACGTNPSSSAVYDASYFKLKTIVLTWQMPQRLACKLGFRNASVNISASNLFAITGYPGADPEISNSPYSSIGGYVDSGSYPTIKQYNVGLRLEF